MIWLKLIIIASITFGLITLVKHFLRRIYNIEKQKKPLRERYPVNDFHKKIHRILNLSSTVVLIISLYLIIYQEFSFNFFLYMLIITYSIQYAVQAYYERKYSENPKQAIITIGEMVIVVIAILAIAQFDLLFA